MARNSVQFQKGLSEPEFEQQGAATREIAVQVQGIAQVTDKATHTMRDVCSAAEQSGTISHTVLSAADQVANQSDGLRQEVDHFLNAVRVSQGNEERRRYERVAGAGASVQLRCGTHGTGSATLRDISLGGASLACEWPCDVGAEVLLALPGGSDMASARIVDSRDGTLAVAFRQEAANLARVTRAVEALTRSTRRAA